MIVRWAGAGAHAAARFFDRSNGSIIAHHHKVNACVRVVPSYKHLGTSTTISANVAGEVNIRAAIIRDETNKISRRFLGNQA
eukprot:7991318-Karenia_brevis.AAC.1